MNIPDGGRCVGAGAQDQVAVLRGGGGAVAAQDPYQLPQLMRTVEWLRESCRREHCLSCQARTTPPPPPRSIAPSPPAL